MFGPPHIHLKRNFPLLASLWWNSVLPLWLSNSPFLRFSPIFNPLNSIKQREKDSMGCQAVCGAVGRVGW